MSDLTLLTLPPSPYNTKVRLALRLKGIEFEPVLVDFQDRSEVVRRSGQPLTPVLIDRDRVLPDSGAILRYLDANWPQAPRLFSAERDTMRAIEGWERWATAEGARGLGLVANLFFSGGPADPAVLAQGQALLEESLAHLEESLAAGPYLLGAEVTAADLAVAPFFRYAQASPEDYPTGSPVRFVAENLSLPARFVRVAAWLERIFAVDVEPASASS